MGNKKKFYSDGTVFVKLPISEQQDLRKEFNEEENKKHTRLNIFTMAMTILLIIIAFASFFVEKWILLLAIPPVAFIIVVMVLNEKKFKSWLKTEKNITKQ